jgi:hypothetical protein
MSPATSPIRVIMITPDFIKPIIKFLNTIYQTFFKIKIFRLIRTSQMHISSMGGFFIETAATGTPRDGIAQTVYIIIVTNCAMPYERFPFFFRLFLSCCIKVKPRQKESNR